MRIKIQDLTDMQLMQLDLIYNTTPDGLRQPMIQSLFVVLDVNSHPIAAVQNEAVRRERAHEAMDELTDLSKEIGLDD